ncbi:hypothetical protein [Nitratireductor sp. GCM10026969]|uniref:hypothetical protein n=1 Tax=Nitratireductor sp. GCM10026969 TaxID=3252645 RepID=UPI00360ACA61
MELFSIRRRSAWADASELEATAAKSARIGDEEMPDRGFSHSGCTFETAEGKNVELKDWRSAAGVDVPLSNISSTRCLRRSFPSASAFAFSA